MPKKSGWRQKGDSSLAEDAGEVRAEVEVKAMVTAGKIVCSWPNAAKDTWIQDSVMTMIEAKRAGAGDGAEPGSMGYVREDVHRRVSELRNTF